MIKFSEEDRITNPEMVIYEIIKLLESAKHTLRRTVPMLPLNSAI